MALKLQELQAREAITNPDGTPSRYFLQYLRSRGGALTDIEAELLNAIELLQNKVDKTTQVIAGTGLTGGGALSGNVTLNVSINDALNTLSTTHGSVLYRGASAWQALSPGTSGYVLQTKGAGLDPAWEPDAYGSGGGGIRPSIVQSASSAGNSGGVTFSVAPTPGNLLVCVGTHWNNISATGVSAGWTIMNNRNGSSTDGNFIGTKIATSADTASISVYGNVSGCCMTIFEIQDSSGVMFLPWNDIQEQTGLTTTTLNMGIPRDNCLLVGAVATVSANTAPTSISGATAGTTVTGTSSNASPRQITPFTNNSISKGAQNVVATYAASPRSYGFGVVVLPV